MAMKLVLAIICVIFSAATSNEIRAKRDLSLDVRNKLIEVLNKDRQEIGKKLNIKMEIVKYDLSLEQSIVWSEGDCSKSPSYLNGTTLGGDNLVLENHFKDIYFFIPSHKSIGCSKDFKCSKTYDDTAIDELKGKTVVYRGICLFGEKQKVSNEDRLKIYKADIPRPSKYGDIIGVDGPSVEGSGAGSVFSLIISLFLIFYV